MRDFISSKDRCYFPPDPPSWYEIIVITLLIGIFIILLQG